MAFPESLKSRVKRRAHFMCCLCHALGVEVHHVVPESEDGPDTEDNAAPLCPSCHETYGANPQKRKFVKEARDLWYDICERRYASDSVHLKRIEEAVRQTASKDDLAHVSRELVELQQLVGRALSEASSRDHYGQQVVEMRARIHDFETDPQAKDSSIEDLEKRHVVTQMGAALALSMGRERSSELIAEAMQAHAQALQVVADMEGMNLEVFIQQFESGIKGDAASKNWIHRLLYYLYALLLSAIHLDTALKISSSVVAVLLEEYDRNPDRSLEELLCLLRTRIRAGELDG